MIFKLPEFLTDMLNFDEDSLVYLNDECICYNKAVPESVVKDIADKSIQIYGGYYEFKDGWNSPKIYLTGRGRNSGKIKLKIENFHPYCYDYSDSGEFKTFLGERVEKIIFKSSSPKTVKRYKEKKSRKGFRQPCEADIPFVRRFLCDVYDLFKPDNIIKPKIAIIDVETNHPVSNEIIAFAINDMENPIIHESKYDVKYLSELALDLYEYLRDYDIIVGWNVDFDIKSIESALEKIQKLMNFAKLGLSLSFDDYIYNLTHGKIKFKEEETKHLLNKLISLGYLKLEKGMVRLGDKELDSNLFHNFAIIDMIPLAKKMYGREIRGNWSLDNVGIRLVGTGKYQLNGKQINELSKEELMQYNVIDTIIPELLESYLGCIEAHLILSWSIQSLLEDTVLTAVVNDIAILREYHKAGVVLPSRDYSEDSSEAKYKAAEPDARPGLYRNVVALDLRHAYPYAVISKNISIETKDFNGENLTPNGIRYNNSKSIFIETLKKIMSERMRVKEKLKTLDKSSTEYRRLKFIDFALKTQAAAFSHGIFGWSNSRMKDYEVADSITAVVREIINRVKEKCDELKTPWIYSHTDSTYVVCEKDKVDDILAQLNKVIAEYSGNSNITPVLEKKGYYKIAYIHSPARNVLVPEDGSVDNPETWNVTGMNFYRSEVPDALADIEIGLLKLKLSGQSPEDMIEYLKERVKALTTEDSRRLGLIKPLNKPISKYGRRCKDGSLGAIPSHIKALLRAMKEYGLKIEVGNKFMVLPIYTNETEGVRKIRRKRVDIAYSIEDGLPSKYKIDFEYYLDSNLWGKIHKLFELTPSELKEKVLDSDVMNVFSKYIGE